DVNTPGSRRVVTMMEDLALDLRYAARSLARSRAVSAVAILTLALGIGATTTMFSVAYAALLRPVPFADSDSLAILYVTRTTPGEGIVRLRWSRTVIARLEESLAAHAPDVAQGFGAASSSFESIASFSSASVAIGGRTWPSSTQPEVVGPPEQVDGE